jgi:hypothetical protein
MLQMSVPSAAELLRVWESGLNQTLLERSLHLLRISHSDTEIETIADLSIGDRDVRLLQLREWLFGANLPNKASCPKCSEMVEWESNANDLRLQAPRPETLEYTLEKDSFTIVFRLPNSHDMYKVMNDIDYQNDHSKILADCIINIKKDEKEVPFETIPATIITALTKRMEEEDPQADIQMLLNCPACNNQWSVSFDIISYLWLEIDHWAKRILGEVVTLAKAFGWSESEILGLSPQRRQIYLDMVRI